MLPLYDPKQNRTVNTGGIGGEQYESPSVLLLNILIELRVMNEMFWDAQRGLVSQTVAQYRSDAVNETQDSNAP